MNSSIVIWNFRNGIVCHAHLSDSDLVRSYTCTCTVRTCESILNLFADIKCVWRAVAMPSLTWMIPVLRIFHVFNELAKDLKRGRRNVIHDGGRTFSFSYIVTSTRQHPLLIRYTLLADINKRPSDRTYNAWFHSHKGSREQYNKSMVYFVCKSCLVCLQHYSGRCSAELLNNM